MRNVIMGNIDEGFEKVAFQSNDVERIIPRYIANLIFSDDGPGLLLELNGKIYSVHGEINKETIRPYFIALKSGKAFNSTDYQILFNIEEFPNNIISGISVTGQRHLCMKYIEAKEEDKEEKETPLSLGKNAETICENEFSSEDAEQIKEMIQRMKKNEFFELLTMELSDKLKGVARELIDFRRDIQEKIEPDMVEIASRDIPEASNQLECINETLEDSTMKIMDINEAQTETANNRIKILKSFFKEGTEVDEIKFDIKDAIGVIKEDIDVLKTIQDRSIKMMTPLSFQDLVGQRIQRIIKLVRSMENRIEELIVSFGIKLIKHKEDPTRSYEELKRDVDLYMNELKGPQRSGQGLNQEAIDDLFKNL